MAIFNSKLLVYQRVMLDLLFSLLVKPGETNRQKTNEADKCGDVFIRRAFRSLCKAMQQNGYAIKEWGANPPTIFC